ncbi:hypothetical protein Poli38472_005312 [Pythium oligandrum]|uniref:Protein kinase domain-containing protein n=1 Tax=Pythium oligandrum TaxID=41045 RepID=A0A8K1CFS8_PYTOL|nr:hypothetical protein Poli38472_005312 [Pythium oligandrum]|eukprot:TMW62694.1 hypothetical protein Poli38472_005312 [Pythium oligandrum]
MSDLDMYKHEEGDRPVERSPRGRYIRFDIRLGTGAYKTVYKAYDTDQGIDVAWNAIDIGVLPSSEKTRIIQEVQLLQKLEHKNIINFYGSWFSKEKNQVVFITEIMTSGNLKSYIKRVQFVKWKIIKRWCLQILEGLHYLHSQNPPVIHRDLKCDNIFINGNTGDLRIGDLGLSTQLAVHKSSRAQSVLGTPEFMAPELYDESYDEKVDIYAFGMCVLEMVTKEVPYSECINPAQIYKKVTAGIRPRGMQRIVSQAARDFIELCLSRGNGLIDVSAEYLLDHPFLKAHEDDGEMVQVLDEDELERELIPTIPEMNTKAFAAELNMESGSKGAVHERRKDHPSAPSKREDLSTGSAGNTATEGLGRNDGTAEEKSAGKNQMIAPAKPVVNPESTETPNPVAPLPPRPPPPAPVANAAPANEEPVVDEPLSGKEDVENHVEEFLSTMPGSETRIRNDRIAVMGGRNHRIEIDESQDYSDEEPAAEQDEQGLVQETDRLSVSSAPTTQPPEAELATNVLISVASDSAIERPRTAPADATRAVRPPSAPRKRGKRYEIKASKDPESEHSILLNLRIAIDGKSKEIKFPFNLFTESPHEVACELAMDVGILEPDLEDIADSISFLVTEGKINNLPHFDQDVWDEAPEPHSFSSKPLPHVSKMNFGGPSAPSPIPQLAGLGSLEPMHDSLNAISSTMVAPRPVQPAPTIPTTPSLHASPAPSLLVPDLPSVTNHDANGLRNETALLLSELSGNPMLHGSDRNLAAPMPVHMTHAQSETGLYGSDEFIHPPPLRERGMSIGGSPVDAALIRSVLQYEDRIKMVRQAYDDRESSLEAAIRSEEEKHQREIERIRKKMQQFNEVTARATMARQERMRLGTDEFRLESDNSDTGDDSSGWRSSVNSASGLSSIVNQVVAADDLPLDLSAPPLIRTSSSEVNGRFNPATSRSPRLTYQPTPEVPLGITPPAPVAAVSPAPVAPTAPVPTEIAVTTPTEAAVAAHSTVPASTEAPAPVQVISEAAVPPPGAAPAEAPAPVTVGAPAPVAPAPVEVAVQAPPVPVLTEAVVRTQAAPVPAEAALATPATSVPTDTAVQTPPAPVPTETPVQTSAPRKAAAPPASVAAEPVVQATAGAVATQAPVPSSEAAQQS